MNERKVALVVVTALVMLEILSASTLGSAWPFAVLHHNSLGLRLLGWYLTLQFSLGCAAYVMVKVIPSKPCPICNLDLKAYAEVHGG